MGKTVKLFVLFVGISILGVVNYSCSTYAQDIIQRQAECDLMKVISSSCDNMPTFAYAYNVDGSLTLLCNAVGFGVPYHISKGATEPSRATWIRCVEPKTKEIKLVYSEAPMIISPFELNADSSYIPPEVPPQ